MDILTDVWTRTHSHTHIVVHNNRHGHTDTQTQDTEITKQTRTQYNRHNQTHTDRSQHRHGHTSTDTSTDTQPHTLRSVRIMIMVTRPTRKRTIMNELKMENQWMRCWKNVGSRYFSYRLTKSVCELCHTTCPSTTLHARRQPPVSHCYTRCQHCTCAWVGVCVYMCICVCVRVSVYM